MRVGGWLGGRMGGRWVGEQVSRKLGGWVDGIERVGYSQFAFR